MVVYGNMYPFLLALHSLLRWFVLVSMLYALYRAYAGWRKQKPYTHIDNTSRHVAATMVHVQLLIGLWLYLVSPVAQYFVHHFKEAIHLREIRFFGLEHITMMITGVIVITIGSMKAKRKHTDRDKFSTQAIWFTAGLLVILSSIPWPFSPLVHRPWVRPF